MHRPYSPLDEINNLYTNNLRERGIGSKAVGWNSPESQELRFEKLTQVINNYSRTVSVNDYGCGYGAHLNYLIKRRGIQVDGYFGYDLSQEMLAAAHSELAWYPGSLSLVRSSVVSTMADYTFVSGTFNVRFGMSDEAWSSFIAKTLDDINHHSRRGFSFNLLSTFVDWKEPHLFYADPSYWFDMCVNRYSRKVVLLHDYPLYEWTILVRKQ